MSCLPAPSVSPISSRHRGLFPSPDRSIRSGHGKPSAIRRKEAATLHCRAWWRPQAQEDPPGSARRPAPRPRRRRGRGNPGDGGGSPHDRPIPATNSLIPPEALPRSGTTDFVPLSFEGDEKAAHLPITVIGHIQTSSGAERVQGGQGTRGAEDAAKSGTCQEVGGAERGCVCYRREDRVTRIQGYIRQFLPQPWHHQV